MTAPDVPPDLADHMARLWRDLRRGAGTSVLRGRMFGHGANAMEPGHMDVLDLLEQQSPRRMSDLADALRVDPSTVTRAIQRMEANDLVERSVAPDDARAVLVRRTPHGDRRWAEVAAVRHDHVSRLLATMDPEEQTALVTLLDRFVRGVNDLTGDSVVAELHDDAATEPDVTDRG